MIKIRLMVYGILLSSMTWASVGPGILSQTLGEPIMLLTPPKPVVDSVTRTVQPYSAHAYLAKFQTYQQWNQQIPATVDPAFISFIETNTPLTQKLRERWLYQLAHSKNWAGFIQSYRTSNDTGLQCYKQLALYQQGQSQTAIIEARKLWLTGMSQPKSCDELFTLLLKNNIIDESLIHQRLTLALDQRNIELANYLIRQYKPARLADIQTLAQIQQNPMRIIRLTPGGLNSDFYLFGLKQLVTRNNNQAIQLWHTPQARQFLNPAQEQAFFAQVALYKAMRNQVDTPLWFSKVKPSFYNDTLLGWQIRFALTHHQWHQVENLINQAKDKDTPGWQYWLARALAAQGKKAEATPIYEALARKRNYYGFLASLQLHKNLSFENEYPASNLHVLDPYKSFTDQILQLHLSKQSLQASRLLNDFVLELPKQDRVALVYWVANTLNWREKALYLSNNDILTNQLALRFPLAYHEKVRSDSSHHHISPELVYAIIRQESGFREDVVSSAGAHGLMQIMPATARKVAKQEHIYYTDKKQLFSTDKNISLGIAYLKDLSKHFGQHPLLMVAAYNAGPRQVNFWLKNHPPKSIDIWIETLPWVETRNYIKNVIAFYAVYQYRLNQKPNLNDFMRPFRKHGP